MSKRLKTAAVLALAGGAVIGSAQGASAATIYWTNWTSDTVGQTTGSAAGTIATPTGSIGVGYAGEVTSETVVNGTSTTGYPSYAPASTYADGTIVADAPTFHDLIAQNGGAGTGMNTLTFSKPVTNLVMAIWSLGSGSDNANYTFSQPFTIVAGGPSNEYGGSGLTRYGANGVSGSEGNGTIVFDGTFSSFSFVNTNFENYYGFTLGVAGIAPPPPPPGVPEPAGLSLLGAGLAALGLARRRAAG